MCKRDAKGSGKPSEPPRRTEKLNGKRNKRLSASASSRSRPLDGYNAESKSRRNEPTSVRSASMRGKNASRYERNAVFGMRKCNESERHDSFVRQSGQLGAPL